jgi:hypothetical protein
VPTPPTLRVFSEPARACVPDAGDDEDARVTGATPRGQTRCEAAEATRHAAVDISPQSASVGPPVQRVRFWTDEPREILVKVFEQMGLRLTLSDRNTSDTRHEVRT